MAVPRMRRLGSFATPLVTCKGNAATTCPPHRGRCCPVEYYILAVPAGARYTTEFRHNLAGEGYAAGAGTRTSLLLCSHHDCTPTYSSGTQCALGRLDIILHAVLLSPGTNCAVRQSDAASSPPASSSAIAALPMTTSKASAHFVLLPSLSRACHWEYRWGLALITACS